MTVKYSINVCVLDEAQTVRRSIESILGQIDDTVEVIVVDGGSTDGTQTVLSDIENDNARVRVFSSPSDGPHTLARDRNFAVQKSDGEYVLVQLDADDRYAPVIMDFVKIYRAIEDCRSDSFFLSGNNINMASKDLLLEYGPYHPLINRGEDEDLWRRLAANRDIIWFDHAPISAEISDDRSFGDRIRDRYSELATYRQTGVSLSSLVSWCLTHGPVHRQVFDLLALPVVYASYDVLDDRTDAPYSDLLEFKRELVLRSASLRELATKYDFDSNSLDLSDTGRRRFDSESNLLPSVEKSNDIRCKHCGNPVTKLPYGLLPTYRCSNCGTLTFIETSEN